MSKREIGSRCSFRDRRGVFVDVKQTDSKILLQHNGFIPEQQRIAIQDMDCNGEPPASPEKGDQSMRKGNVRQRKLKKKFP